MESILIFTAELLVTTVFLWLGMKLTQTITGTGWSGEYCQFRYLALAALASCISSMIPYIGFLLSWIVLLGLLIKFTETSLKDVLIMVVFAKALSFIATVYLFVLI
jgi:predicted PurR-regulated permease PerM